ncbi:hypothetical protein Leryth_008900 [Lithospermum erythrorhizon]|nr:hypothetical protein Leryth_008900 [Lithospermum erythrorhizon]
MMSSKGGSYFMKFPYLLRIFIWSIILDSWLMFTIFFIGKTCNI